MRLSRRKRRGIIVLAVLVAGIVLLEIGLYAYVRSTVPPYVIWETKDPDVIESPPDSTGAWGDPFEDATEWRHQIRHGKTGDQRVPGGLEGSRDPDCQPMGHFESMEDLRDHLADPPQETDPFLLDPGLATFFWTDTGSGTSTTAYSSTNNQVEGVDEADIVKTDGQRIYTLSGGSVVILDAVPPQTTRLLSKFSPGGSVLGLFVNGDRLVVLTTSWWPSSSTRLLVYDVSVPARPVMDRNVTVSGRYLGSRMIGDYVYLIASQWAYDWRGNLSLPTIWLDGVRRDLSYSEIDYLNDSKGASEVTVVLSVKVPGSEPPRYAAFVAHSASELYVSQRNVFIAASTRTDYSEASRIHRLWISGGRICYVGSVQVPGTILNQFSMDEYNGYLRVATTIGQVAQGGGNARNNVYVVNGTFSVVGRLEGLAPGEQIYSARFMGDRAYLVTFKKIDPFFVIDLSDPFAPAVLGYLKIPGFSDYLHPFDATHVIGLGRDTYDMGGFAWFQGLKLSLFDVADVEHPQEVAKIVIGDRGTFSMALWDHKAFLFIRSRNLIVLPVDLYLIDRVKHPDADPSTGGEFVWQGAYVISVTPDSGFEIRGRISHFEDGVAPSYYLYGSYAVRRSLYIGDYLYTLSNSVVKANALDTLEEVARVRL